MKKKPTVTIGIPAYNEESSIKKLLLSLLRQKREGFMLKEIVVLSDGSTDKTDDIVLELRKKHKNITLIRDARRTGKSGRLNEFFSKCTTDIAVVLDADTVLYGKGSLEAAVTGFLRQKRAGLVAFCDRPHEAKTTVQKIIITGIALWDAVREDFNDGHSVHGIHGCGYAVSRNLYRKIAIPQSVFNDDEFLYLTAKLKGFPFLHVCEARVLYRAPMTVADYIKQSARFSDAREKTYEYFGNEAESEFALPSGIKYKHTFFHVLRSPFFAGAAHILQISYRLLRKMYAQDYALGYWEPVMSTKSSGALRVS